MARQFLWAYLAGFRVVISWHDLVTKRMKLLFSGRVNKSVAEDTLISGTLVWSGYIISMGKRSGPVDQRVYEPIPHHWGQTKKTMKGNQLATPVQKETKVPYCRPQEIYLLRYYKSRVDNKYQWSMKLSLLEKQVYSHTPCFIFGRSFYPLNVTTRNQWFWNKCCLLDFKSCFNWFNCWLSPFQSIYRKGQFTEEAQQGMLDPRGDRQKCWFSLQCIARLQGHLWKHYGTQRGNI